MAGGRKCVGPVNYHELPRKKLQALCKRYGFPANKTNVAMADSLTALLNVPGRLASRIDSPAISSKSSYLSSSCDVEESPMISPGVDSLPSISELGPEVFEGLRITKLPEIMEAETPPRVTVKNTEEMTGRCETDKMHASEIIERMTDNSVAAESSHPDSNSKDIEVCENNEKLDAESAVSEGLKIDKDVKEIECSEVPQMDDSSPGIHREYNAPDCTDTTRAVIDDFVITAGPSSDNEAKDVEFSEYGQTVPDEFSRSEDLRSENEATNMQCEDKLQAPLESQLVDRLEPTSHAVVEVIMCTSEVMNSTPLPVSEEMTEASDCSLDEVTKSVLEATSDPNSEDRLKGCSEELRESVTRDDTAETVTHQVELISSTDHATEAFNVSEPCHETVEAESNTPLPLSVMPHSAVSDLSVSNKEGVSLVVELSNKRFPRIDLFETDGDIKISSHTSEGMKSRAGSDGLPCQETEVLRMAWRQDEVFGFKCLNPAALSPKVRRSLGIDIPKMSVSKLTISTICRASFVEEDESEFSFDVPLTKCSPAALVPLKVAQSGDTLDIERNTTFPYHETACLSDDETSESMDFVPCEEKNGERSESCPPIPGYVKEIVDLLENKSGEESRELAGATRKDVYKQSQLVRSSRIAADIERAAKLGQAKRAEVLAGKRSLLLPTTSSGSIQAAELNNEENEALQSINSGLPMRDGTADSTKEHDADLEEILPLHTEEFTCGPILSETNPEDTPELVQDNQIRARDIQLDSLAHPTQQVGNLTDVGMSVNDSSPTETAESVPAASDVAQKYKKPSAEEVEDDDSSPTPSEETTDAGLPEIKYVEIPRPVETNVECGPISELSWIRKATNLPTPKAQKPNEKIKRPISANLRKFELMERAALNVAKKHRTPKKTPNAKVETLDAPATYMSGISASWGSQEPTTDVVDVEMEELSFAPVDRSLSKTPDKSTAGPLSPRDCNKDVGLSSTESCQASPKSPSIFLDEILRESTQSRGNENLRGKENERLRRHQEEYKTPITGRAKEKALRTAEMNAASLREKILKQRRGIEEEEPSGNSANALKNALLSRLL